MKNKKLIRLTESDLHRIVKESVNNVLTELDWKTYANAANKAIERGNTKRGDRFGDAAKDAFNRDYGYKHDTGLDNDYASVKLGGDFHSTEEFSPHAVGYGKNRIIGPRKYEHGWSSHPVGHYTPEEFFNGNVDAAQAYRNADDEVKNWKRGNYKYDSIKDGGEGKWIKKR